MLKMAVLAPMPRARVRMAMAAKPGDLRRVRAAKRASCKRVSRKARQRVMRPAFSPVGRGWEWPVVLDHGGGVLVPRSARLVEGGAYRRLEWILWCKERG